MTWLTHDFQSWHLSFYLFLPSMWGRITKHDPYFDILKQTCCFNEKVCYIEHNSYSNTRICMRYEGPSLLKLEKSYYESFQKKTDSIFNCKNTIPEISSLNQEIPTMGLTLEHLLQKSSKIKKMTPTNFKRIQRYYLNIAPLLNILHRLLSCN